jgi:hypothetical protein
MRKPGIVGQNAEGRCLQSPECCYGRYVSQASYLRPYIRCLRLWVQQLP